MGSLRTKRAVAVTIAEDCEIKLTLASVAFDVAPTETVERVDWRLHVQGTLDTFALHKFEMALMRANAGLWIACGFYLDVAPQSVLVLKWREYSLA